jgi:hypothetical protein
MYPLSTPLFFIEMVFIHILVSHPSNREHMLLIIENTKLALFWFHGQHLVDQALESLRRAKKAKRQKKVLEWERLPDVIGALVSVKRERLYSVLQRRGDVLYVCRSGVRCCWFLLFLSFSEILMRRRKRLAKTV